MTTVTTTKDILSNTSRLFYLLLTREFKVYLRAKGDMLNPILFIFLVSTLFPLGIGADKNKLSLIGCGIIWVSVLLSNLLSLDTLFRSDFEDGFLELALLGSYPLITLVFIKVFVHWLLSGFLITCFSPLLAIMFQVPLKLIPILSITLLLGTPFLSILGSVGAALTVTLGKNGVLLSLLILPLFIPVLILATGCIYAAQVELDWLGYIYWMGALLVMALTIFPFAITAGLKISLYR